MQSLTQRLVSQRSFKAGLALQVLALLLVALPVVAIANGWLDPAQAAPGSGIDSPSLKHRVVERSPVLGFLAFCTAIALQVRAIRKVM